MVMRLRQMFGFPNMDEDLTKEGQLGGQPVGDPTVLEGTDATGTVEPLPAPAELPPIPPGIPNDFPGGQPNFPNPPPPPTEVPAGDLPGVPADIPNDFPALPPAAPVAVAPGGPVTPGSFGTPGLQGSLSRQRSPNFSTNRIVPTPELGAQGANTPAFVGGGGGGGDEQLSEEDLQRLIENIVRGGGGGRGRNPGRRQGIGR